MFEKEQIVQLHSQGWCTGYIAIRLGVPSDYVRKVVAQAASRQAVNAATVRRQKAESKRAKALRLLEEVNAESVLE